MSLKQILPTVIFTVILGVIPLESSHASQIQPIVGSWCGDVTRNGVTRPIVLNFTADGQFHSLPGTPFPAPGNDSTARTSALGEVEKMGRGEWEANFQIFLTKFDATMGASNYNGRQVIRLPVFLAPDGTISDGGNGLTITLVDKNDNVTGSIVGNYQARRIDSSSPTLCSFNINPPIP